MKKMIKIVIVVLAMLLSMGALFEIAVASEERPGRPRPYGGYCRGPRWGWYGANRPVGTVEEARQNLEKYFEGRDVTIGTIIERRGFFEAEIKDKKGGATDRVIIHKRTGRIRSVY
jgi:hypothetical protein